MAPRRPLSRLSLHPGLAAADSATPRRPLAGLSGRTRPLLLCAPALATLAAAQILISRPFIDDSYIFYRYAANWAHGLGPVFNRGEHVEGFSSFLWTAVLAVTAALGGTPLRAAPVLGVAMAAGCLVLVVALARGPLGFSAWLAALAALAVALSPAFEIYASSGMDVPLFSVVLLWAVGATAGYVEAVRRQGAATGWGIGMASSLAALVLVRAEGPIYALAIALVAAGLCGRRGHPSRTRSALLPVAIAAAATGLSLAARELSYGGLVPATVQAKGYTNHLAGEALVHPERLGHLWQTLGWGFDYVGAPAMALLGLAVVALAVQRRADQHFAAVPTLATVVSLLSITIAIWGTGDWMPYRRLLVPALPLMVLLGAWAFRAIIDAGRAHWAANRGHTWAVRLAAIGGIGLGLLCAGLVPGPVAPEYEARQLSQIGRILANLPHPARVLTNLAGVLPYYAGTRTYVWDILGLTDSHNAAHGYIYSPQFGRTDPRYDFTRRFDLFVSNSSWDFALLNQMLPAKGHRWLLFSPASWKGIPLYVVARQDGALRARLEQLCGCRPVPLDGPQRARQLAVLAARGALPPGLLEAARAHRPFPA